MREGGRCALDDVSRDNWDRTLRQLHVPCSYASCLIDICCFRAMTIGFAATFKLVDVFITHDMLRVNSRMTGKLYKLGVDCHFHFKCSQINVVAERHQLNVKSWTTYKHFVNLSRNFPLCLWPTSLLGLWEWLNESYIKQSISFCARKSEF